MTPEQSKELIRLLEEGKDLSPEWARVLFPPERREYELVYYGKERAEEILAETMAVPLQPVRTFGGSKTGDGDWQNMLVFGDNLQALKALVELKRAGTLRSADGTRGVKLVYIDPPFATEREFQGAKNQKAYQDKIAGAEFIEFLRKRLVLLREVMADDSTIYVHLDTKKSHYIKVILDELFDESAFVSEVIWKRTNARSTSGMWPRMHDTLLVYTKGAGAKFTPVLVKADAGKLPHTLITGPDGRKYQTFELTGQGVTKDGESGRPWRGFNPAAMGRHWANQHSVMDKWDEQGLIHWPKKKDGFPRRRAAEPFIPDARTVMVGDVWADIDRINQSAAERSGYPTQKPEELLARVLQASSQPGDLVLDAFAGSGTTFAVAEKMGRRWLGIDSGKLAIYTIQKRMLSLRQDIGNTGAPLSPRPFTLFNAGLYDFSKLKDLPWDAWRFFALQLFQCRDYPHKMGGVEFDGTLKGASVLVFNHKKVKGARVDEATVESLHQALGAAAGGKIFIIAPALTFGFQQDYIDIDETRYYALRIPYSIIHELHQREFRALRQPSDEREVNETVEAVGFDFIKPPELKQACGIRMDGDVPEAFVRLTSFKSAATVRGPLEKKANFETLSMVMVDYDYDEAEQLFELDEVFFAEQMQAREWEIRFPHAQLGKMMMAVFIDIYGNEARIPIAATEFGEVPAARKKTARKRTVA